MDEFKRVIEVNGVKVEIDLRTAKRVDSFKVGDAVKLLKKEYSDSFKSYPGVIVGFDEFQNRPTLIVAYVSHTYSETKLEFAYINKDSKELEIAPAQDFETKISSTEIEAQFDKRIEAAELALKKVRDEKTWFQETYLKYFGKFFKEFGADLNNSN